MKYEKVDVHIIANAHEAKRDGLPSVKITITKFPNVSASDTIGEFYIPTATYLKGYPVFVAAIKSRAKHDLKIEIGHYSSCGW